MSKVVHVHHHIMHDATIDGGDIWGDIKGGFQKLGNDINNNVIKPIAPVVTSIAQNPTAQKIGKTVLKTAVPIGVTALTGQPELGALAGAVTNTAVGSGIKPKRAGRFPKGSAEAKRFMAELRAKRKT